MRPQPGDKQRDLELFEDPAVIPTDVNFSKDKNANQRFKTMSLNDVTGDVIVDDEEDGNKIYSWKEVALILDRFFMYLFVVLIVGATLICLAIMGSKY